MTEKAILKFVVSIITIFLLGLIGCTLGIKGIISPKENLSLFVTILLLGIFDMIFFLVTHFMYCSKRKKNKTEKVLSKGFLRVLSDEGDNKYVFKKFCNEGCIYMFQYLDENNVENKNFVAKKTSSIKIKELVNSNTPYIEKVESIYVPKKKSLLDYLHYDVNFEEKNKLNYVLYINNDMVFSDTNL